ncbi:MAG TPA: hypothetical protein VMV92_44515 [Streptosporangiaceae bacterium]|nr:hypothetical protein [Streptosporangiaceae bacterium]
MACPIPGRGTGALGDLARSGQPRSVDETAITVATLEWPPGRLGDDALSSRLLARELGISLASVVEAWRKQNLQERRGGSIALRHQAFSALDQAALD